MARPMLDDLELQLVQKIEIDEDQVLTQHSVPAMEGDFLQGLQRRARQITLTGVLTGPEVGEGLKALRDKFRAAEPVPFVTDITTATRVEQVLIEEMGVRELAGKPERFEYAFTLREYIPAEEVITEDPPPDPEPPEPPDDDIDENVGTLIVEVIVEGQPEFDFSQVTVTVQGTTQDSETLSRALTNREDNIWTEEEIPASQGEYTVSAVVTGSTAMSGSATTAVQAGQTATVTITLRPGVAIAKAFVIHFKFDKAFIEPCMRPVMKQVATYAEAHPQEKLLIVGHTDKVGDSAMIPPLYNQSLSERRARSAYAYLTFGNNPQAAIDEWNHLRQNRTTGQRLSINDSWGVHEYQHILQYLDYYPGEIDGDHRSLTDAAVEAFRCDCGLPPGQNVDGPTWEKLIEKYLQKDPLNIPQNRFFANAKDSCNNGIVKWLGCGEEDPLSQPNPPTDKPHRPYRRVEFLFINATTIPCDNIPEPDTFNLPPPDNPNTPPNIWCLGTGTSGPHCCFLTRDENHQGNLWLVQPVDQTRIDVNGTITFEEFEPNKRLKFRLNITAPDGEYVDGENPSGTRKGLPKGKILEDTTDASGNVSFQFAYTNKPSGIYTLEIEGLSSSQIKGPFIIHRSDEDYSKARGNSVCKLLGSSSDRLDVTVPNVPIMREINLPVAAHVMTPLNDDGSIRRCISITGASIEQHSTRTDDEIRGLFSGANRIWRQARILFDPVVITHETYRHPINDPAIRGSCEVDDNEFNFILSRCAIPDVLNVFFFGDFAGTSEAGKAISVENARAAGAGATPGCAVSDRFQFTILGVPNDQRLTEQQSIQVLAHELGHYLNLTHTTTDPSDADRLMFPNTTLSGSNIELISDEIDTARNSLGASSGCVPLTLQVTGVTQIGGTLSNQYIFVQHPEIVDPFDIIVEAEIPDHLLASGTLMMTDGTNIVNGRQFPVSKANTGEITVTATYTPTGGGQPVSRHVVIRVATFNLEVNGACQVGSSNSTTFIIPEDNAPNAQVTIVARLDPAPFCVPDDLVRWERGRETDDPLRQTLSRGSVGQTTIQATVAGETRSVTILVSTFTLRVEGATRVGGTGSTTFAAIRASGTAVTVTAELDPAPSPVPANLVTWTPSSPSPDPLRQTITRATAAETILTAELCGVTRQVTIHVVEVDSITKTDPARPAFDNLSDPNEPVLTVCETDTARLRINVTPNAAQVFYTTNPNNVVDLNPTQRAGDGEVTVQPRALPVGTNRVNGRDTRLSVRLISAHGPEIPRNSNPARVRIRQFERIDAHLFLHIVRNDDGNLPGTSLNTIVNNFNTALAEANTLWSRACIRLVPRRLPSGTLNIDFIDETDLLDISATFDGTGGVTFPDDEDDNLFTHGGVNRNTANPTFINLYLIDRFDGAPNLGGVAGGNHLIIIRTMNGSLLAHELGHCLGLRDLDKTGITNLARRLMRSAQPRGEILTSSGAAGDEIRTARNRAVIFTG